MYITIIWYKLINFSKIMAGDLQYLVNVKRNFKDICMWTRNVFDQTVYIKLQWHGDIKLRIIKGYNHWETLPFPYTTQVCFNDVFLLVNKYCLLEQILVWSIWNNEIGMEIASNR